jgi:hypothetical protein
MAALEFKKARRITTDQREGSLWLGEVFGRLTPAEMREDAKVEGSDAQRGVDVALHASRHGRRGRG